MDRSKALTWTELRVGLVVIASLVILAATVLYIGGGGTPWSRKYTVRALMSDVNGLKPGAPVRLGGVEVGAVSEVELAPGSEGHGRGRDEAGPPRAGPHHDDQPGRAGLARPAGGEGRRRDGGRRRSAARGRRLPLGLARRIPFKGLLSDASDSTAHLKRILSRLDAGEGLFGKALRDEELYTRMTDVSVRLQNVLTRLESDRGPLGRLVNDEDMSRRMASSVRSLEAVASRVEKGEGTLGALVHDPRWRASSGR